MPEPTGAATLTTCHLGFTPYREGLRLQEGLVEARAAGTTGDWLVYPDHPPVLTIGRSPSEGALLADPGTLARMGIETFEVSRGGDITWHGPGQVVGYAVCDLTRRGRDVRRFLRDLEEVLVEVLASSGIAGRAIPGRTGVWVGDAKIASIGVAVRRWVTYHGFALNLAPDLWYFDLIHPCGLRGIHMTSMAAELGDACPTPVLVRAQAANALARRLGHAGPLWVPAAAAFAAAARMAAPEPAGTRHDDRAA